MSIYLTYACFYSTLSIYPTCTRLYSNYTYYMYSTLSKYSIFTCIYSTLSIYPLCLYIHVYISYLYMSLFYTVYNPTFTCLYSTLSIYPLCLYILLIHVFILPGLNSLPIHVYISYLYLSLFFPV